MACAHASLEKASSYFFQKAPLLMRDLVKFCHTLLTGGAYHLVKKSGNFGLKSNGKIIFHKFRLEIVEYLLRYSSFFIRNGTAENSLPFE